MYLAAVIYCVFHSFDEAVAAWSGFGRLKIADCVPYTGLIASRLADAQRSIDIPKSFSLPTSTNIQTLLLCIRKDLNAPASCFTRLLHEVHSLRPS
jgi:hypothetical protein